MISVKQVEKITPEIEEFQKKEWGPADKKHFGSFVEWKHVPNILTARDGEELVGLLELDMKAGVMHVQSILVKHGRQGEGIGKRLMEEAEKIAREHKNHKMYLETGENWHAAKFYEKLGFHVVARLPDYWVHHDFVIYEKRLNSEV